MSTTWTLRPSPHYVSCPHMFPIVLLAIKLWFPSALKRLCAKKGIVSQCLFFPCHQEMKVSKKTTFRTVKWDLLSMQYMQWLTVFTTCTRSCALGRRDSVRPWIQSMEASCSTTCWRRLSEGSRARRFTLTRMETRQEGRRIRTNRELFEFQFVQMYLMWCDVHH